MGHTATKGNSLVGHKPQIKFPARYHGPVGAVKVEEFEPITDGPATLAPNYSRGAFPTKGSMSTGQTLLGIHLTNGVAFRKVSATREELKVKGGKLVLRMATVKKQKFWIGEYVQTGVKGALVLVAIPVIKGDPPVKGDARDLLIVKAVQGVTSIY